VAQGFEHLVGPQGQAGVTRAAGDRAEGIGEEGLAHAHGADDGDVGALLEKAQGDELVEHGLVVADGSGLVPAFQAHGRVQACPLRTDGSGLAVRAGGLVGENEQEEILVGGSGAGQLGSAAAGIGQVADRLGLVWDEDLEDAAKEGPGGLAGLDGLGGSFGEARVDEPVAGAYGGKDEGAEPAAAAGLIRLKRAHRAGVELEFLAGAAVGYRDRGRVLSQRELRTGKPVKSRVGNVDALPQQEL
jgi:hypothetical protein